MLKAQTFMHYTHTNTNSEMMVTDIQGFDFQLTDPDPEFATTTIRNTDDK